jgi:hypothetical protein
MDNNHFYVPFKLAFLIAVLMLLCFTSCSDGKSIYTFSKSQQPVVDTIAVQEIKLYLETSASMRGYVNSNVSGTYPLKDIVPNMVTDLDNHFDLKTKLITISDRQHKFPYSKVSFFEQVRSGRIFTGKSSKLQNIFSIVISETNTGAVSILISDCIPDLGRINTKTEGSKITNHIYSIVSANKTLGVAVFKYKSDFNGTFYYNSNNNDGVAQSKRPFYKQTLNNRPFYVWVFGNHTAVKKVLATNTIKGYDMAHAYNMPFNTTEAGLLKNPKSGKISINPEKGTLLIKEIDAERPALFTIGLNGKSLSKVQQEQLLDTTNYKVIPSYIQESITFNLKQKEALLSEDIKDKSEIQNGDYTYFIQPALSDFDLQTQKFSINIFNKQSSWIKNTNLIDDIGIAADALEGKTFGFEFITDAFANAYPAKQPQITFTLTKQKQK